MSLAQYIAESVVTEGRKVTELCRKHHVSRSWVYELAGRFREYGPEGLVLRSKRPHHCPNVTPESIQTEILEIRDMLADAGLYNGAESIIDELENRSRLFIPSARTIYRILKAHNKVIAQPQKKPKPPLRRFVADLPNERWQSDVTHYPLANGTQVEIINFEDDHSRLFIASQAVPVATAEEIVHVFRAGVAIHGLPASVLTDNGAIYTAKYRLGKQVMESVLDDEGIIFKHGKPNHPQTQGKIERLHQTLKKWLRAQIQPETIEELQILLDTFVAYYNNQRRHRGIKRKTPHDIYNASIKAKPGLFNQQTHFRVRHDRIDQAGKLTLRYRTKLVHLGVGRAHAGKVVKILIADRDVRVITPEGELLAKHTLNTMHNYHRNELGDSTMF